MNEQFHWIDLVKLHDHPQNPRLIRRDDVINAIAAGINGSFDPAHALIVRPLADGYQVVSGHNRKLAAKQQDLKQVPCWVRELDDDAAYMLLLTSNNQGELTALERGLHALHSVADGAKLDVKAYAAKAGRARQTVQNEVMAARVANAVPHVGHELADRYKALVEIHAAPQWLWPALVDAMLDEKWTVENTRQKVARSKDLPKVLPGWAASDLPAKLIAGQLRTNDLARMAKIADDAEVEIRRRDFEVDKYLSELAAILKKGGIGSASQMLALTDPVIAAQRQADQEALRAAEEAEVRAQRLYEYVSQDEWNTLDNAVREALLNPDPKAIKPLRFNKQDGPSPLSALLGSFVCIGVAWVRRLPRMRSSTWEAQRPSF